MSPNAMGESVAVATGAADNDNSRFKSGKVCLRQSRPSGGKQEVSLNFERSGCCEHTHGDDVLATHEVCEDPAEMCFGSRPAGDHSGHQTGMVGFGEHSNIAEKIVTVPSYPGSRIGHV